MRLIAAICGLSALALAQSAAAVTVSAVTFSPEFETELEENFGEREGVTLQRDVERSIAAALARRGVAGAEGSVEVTIVDAVPNRPTFQQLSDQPGLDPIRSVSIGGAELRGVIRDSSGNVVSEVEHRHYSSLNDYGGFAPIDTWGDARRTIDRFARKVADAYAGQSRR